MDIIRNINIVKNKVNKDLNNFFSFQKSSKYFDVMAPVKDAKTNSTDCHNKIENLILRFPL